VVITGGGSRGVQVLLSAKSRACMWAWRRPCRQRSGADLRARHVDLQHHPDHHVHQAGVKSGRPQGKTFGISAFGSETDIAISIGLKKLGSTARTSRSSRSAAARKRFAALTAGRIDAVPLLEPAITMAKEKGFNPILDLAAQKTPWIFDSVVGDQGLYAEERRHADALRARLSGRAVSSWPIQPRARRRSASASRPRTRK
jgi:hypothetical protein